MDSFFHFPPHRLIGEHLLLQINIEVVRLFLGAWSPPQCPSVCTCTIQVDYEKRWYQASTDDAGNANQGSLAEGCNFAGLTMYACAKQEFPEKFWQTLADLLSTRTAQNGMLKPRN